MVNFYHRFLPNIAEVLAPLHALASVAKSPKSPLDWSSNPAAAAAFDSSLLRLQSSRMLAHPSPNPSRLTLTTDASDTALGAVLAQGEDSRPLAFFSRKLNSAERNYSAFDKELLGVKAAIEHFHHLLELSLIHI